MAFCRWSCPIENSTHTSDAYVYASNGGFLCHWCGGENFWCSTAKEMAEYLTQQKASGKLVPQSAIDDLYEEE